MSHVPEDIQRLIASARRAAPDDAALGRVWQRLQAPPGPGGDDLDVPDPASLADTTSAVARKASLITGLKAVAAVIAVAAGIAGASHLRSDAPPPKPAPPIAAPAPLPTPQPAPPPFPPTTEQPAPQRVRPPPKPADDPAAERVLLESAQSALQRTDPAAALQHLSEHTRRFPRGALADERAVLQVLALCAAGRPDEAETTGRALLASAGAGLFTPRLRGSCVGPRLFAVQRPQGL